MSNRDRKLSSPFVLLEAAISHFGAVPLSVALFGSIAVFVSFAKQSNEKRRLLKEKEEYSDFDGVIPPDGPAFMEFNKGFKGTVGPDLCGDPMTITHNAALWTSWVGKYGKIFRIPSPKPGKIPEIVLVADSTATKEVFLKHDNMYRGNYSFTRTKGFLRDSLRVFGRCLFSTEGEEWKWRKDSIMREFHKSRMVQDPTRQFFERVTLSGDSLCNDFAKLVDEGKPISMNVINKLTFKATANVIFFFLFGRDVSFDQDEFYRGAVYLLEHFNYLRGNLEPESYKYVPGTNSYKAEMKRKAAWAAMDAPYAKEVEIMVKEHLGEIPVASNRKPGSMLATLLKKEPRFYKQGVKYLVEDLRLIVHAGFESTSNAVAFALGVLAERPDLGKRIAAEGIEIMKKQGDSDVSTFIPKDVGCLESAVISKGLFLEGLRLYPPAISLHGRTLRNINFKAGDGKKYKVAKGSTMLFLCNAMQRDPENIGSKGGNPNVADPERWNVPVSDQPFLSTFKMGAHVCPGKSLSLMEGHLMILMVATRLTFVQPNLVGNDWERETDIPNHEVILARPKDGPKLIVKRNA